MRLSERQVVKREFDAANIAERKLALRFLETYTWKGLTEDNMCPFICKWPHTDVPAMIKDRLLDYYKTTDKAFKR